jgi:hypothetical protein
MDSTRRLHAGISLATIDTHGQRVHVRTTELLVHQKRHRADFMRTAHASAKPHLGNLSQNDQKSSPEK